MEAETSVNKFQFCKPTDTQILGRYDSTVEPCYIKSSVIYNKSLW